MKFTPQGYSLFNIEKNVLVHNPLGVFNGEGVKHAWSAIYCSIESEMANEPWCLIEELDKDANATAEALEELVQEYQKLPARRCLKVFIVCQDNNIAHWYLDKVAQNSGVPYTFCDTVEDAKKLAAEVLGIPKQTGNQ